MDVFRDFSAFVSLRDQASHFEGEDDCHHQGCHPRHQVLQARRSERRKVHPEVSAGIQNSGTLRHRFHRSTVATPGTPPIKHFCFNLIVRSIIAAFTLTPLLFICLLCFYINCFSVWRGQRRVRHQVRQEYPADILQLVQVHRRGKGNKKEFISPSVIDLNCKR